MELRVRDVFANAHYKGRVKEWQLEGVHQSKGCKAKYRLGNDICGGRNCHECFDTPIEKIEEFDRSIRGR